MRKLTLQLTLVFLIFIGACSESAVFDTPEQTDANDTTAENAGTDEPVNDNSNPDDTTDDSTNEFQDPDDYDLALYFFHSNTQTSGGEIAFTEKYYEKPSGDGPIRSRAIKYLNTGTSIEVIDAENSVLHQFTITINSIKEIGVSFEGAQTIHRFTALGEVYLDAVIESLNRRDTCTLQNHLDVFDLGDAIDSATIATGVYEDVLHVFCNRVLDLQDGGTTTNYSWNAYYANGVGLLFADGNWVVLDENNNWLDVGNAYLIHEY